MAVFPQEPVLRKVYLFFAMSSAGLMFVIMVHFALEYNQSYYLNLEQNERVKNQISLFVQQRIRSLQIEFQYMLLAASTVELENANNEIVEYINQVKKAVDVIENGGMYTEDIFVNFGNRESITQQFEYVATSREDLSLSVIEMRTNLTRLEEMRAEYFSVMQKELEANVVSGQRKLTLFHKRISPFFTRLAENSNRLYVESLEVLNRAERARKSQDHLIRLLSSILLPVFLLFAVWVAVWILRDIQRLMKERSRAVEALQSTNENLEEMVAQRTLALSEEVNERKLAEERFSAQAEFLTNVIESLGHPFYVVNVEDYSVSMSNQAAKDMALNGNDNYCYGMSHGQECPCSGKEHPCPILEVTSTKQPVIMEHCHHSSDGKERIVEVHGFPIFDSRGEVVQMIEYNLDVTERHLARKALESAKDDLEIKVLERTKRLEQEVDDRIQIQLQLEASERHFRNLIEGIKDIIAILDKDGIITYMSPSVFSVLGLDSAKMIGRSFQEFVFVDEQPVSRSLFINGVKRNEPIEHQVLDADGNYRIMESSIQDKFDVPDIGGLLVTTRDVTARKSAEQMQRRLNMVIEQNPSSVVITDTGGRIEYVNPEFEKSTGYSREEAIGQNPNILNSGKTDPAVFKEMYATITKGDVWGGEFINKRKDGELYIESVIVAPIKDIRGNITNYAALKENITELKKARELAESANKAKSEFLSRMSHELRTPLNAIIGFSKLLLDNKQQSLSEKQTEQASRIHGAGQHLTQMISKILDFSRMEAGNLSLIPEAVSLEEVVEECIALTDHLTHKNRIGVELDSSLSAIPQLNVDRIRFKQVMVNLISNAVKYNVEDGKVLISAVTEDNQVKIMVADTGIGMSPEQQKELFVPFTRLAEDALSIEGTGIGMTITRQLLEAMDGTISFTSEEGSGSEFTVSLPMVGSSSAGAGPAAEMLDMTILYIDDNKERIGQVRKDFSSWDEATLVVRRKKEKALQGVSLLEPDLILVDESFTGEQDFFTEVEEKMKDGSRIIIVCSEEKPGPDSVHGKFIVLQGPITPEKIINENRGEGSDV